MFKLASCHLPSRPCQRALELDFLIITSQLKSQIKMIRSTKSFNTNLHDDSMRPSSRDVQPPELVREILPKRPARCDWHRNLGKRTRALHFKKTRKSIFLKMNHTNRKKKKEITRTTQRKDAAQHQRTHTFRVSFGISERQSRAPTSAYNIISINMIFLFSIC